MDLNVYWQDIFDSIVFDLFNWQTSITFTFSYKNCFLTIRNFQTYK